MRVFLSGFGTVGQGLMETAVIKKDLIRSLTGEELVFAGAVDSKTYYIDPKEVCCFCALGTKATYLPSFDEIETFILENCVHGDLLITMGAGDIVKVGEKLLGM